MSLRPWKVLERRVLVDRQWLKVVEERAALPNGTVIEAFHRMEVPAWVAVVALTEARELILVDQYRRGLDGISRELPAGVIEPGEDPLAAAQRELEEETGFRAERWTALATVAPEPSRSTARAHLFVAHGARPVGPQRLDDSEEVVVRLVPLEEALAAVEAGALVHGTHLGALLLAQRKGLLG